MPTVRKSNLIAVCCSDLHLSLTAPACRADKDWLGVQQHYLEQLKDVAKGVPVLCAGDIFDRWNAPPELLNFALKHLPDGMVCVPGQHDLPNHRIEDVHRSGYGVLVQAGKIRDISNYNPRWFEDLKNFGVHGFGWGAEITRPERAGLKRIALIHRYVWSSAFGYPGAPEDTKLSSPALEKMLKGYDVAVTGDNHQGFLGICGETIMCNCGGFIRRKSDEMERTPFVGLIYSDGQVQRHKLDTSIDRFHADAQDRAEVPVDVQQFLEELRGLGEHGLNFAEIVRQHLEKGDVNPNVAQIIRESLNAH